MFSKENFAQRLKLLMQAQNLTHQAMADSIGISRSAVSQYLSCVKRPSIDHLMTIGRYFDVSLDFLVGETDEPKRNCLG